MKLLLRSQVKPFMSLEMGSIMLFEKGDIQLHVPANIIPGTILQQVRMRSDRRYGSRIGPTDRQCTRTLGQCEAAERPINTPGLIRTPDGCLA